MAQDADKQKLIEIEKAFAANATQGPELAALASKYFYDGPLSQLTGLGVLEHYPRQGR